MDLTPEQHETLLNFQAITENWDPTLSLQILSRNNWDLQNSISEYVAFAAHIEQLQNLTPVYEPPQPPVRRHTIGPTTTQPTPQPKGFFSKMKSVIGEIMANPIPVYSHSVEEFQQKLKSISPDLYPVVNTLMLKDVISVAREKKKMLAIYIHSKENSWEYVRNVICGELTVMVLDEFYVFWPVERESGEGEMAEYVLKPSNFPCLAAVSVESLQPVVLEKLEGEFQCEKVVSFLTRNYIPRPVINDNQRELIKERKLRAQQEKELKEAERQVELRKIEEKKRQEAEILKKNQESQKKQQEEQKRLEKLERIGEEPNGSEASQISFRLPNGSKLDRKFHKTQTVSILYDYLDTQNCSNCEILFGFPATPLNNFEDSLESSGIHPKALLIVRNLQSE